MAYQVYTDNGIIYDILKGDYTAEEITENVKELNKLTSSARSENEKVLILIDTTDVGRQNSRARKAGEKALRELDYDKFAVTGSNMFLKHLIILIIKATGREDKVQFFDSREEAVDWLLKK